MTRVPSVAICIGCFNQGHYLEGAIQSALSQTYSNVEVWVSDDCSTDDTPREISILSKTYTSVKFFRQKVNLGIAGNYSWLFAQPTTELIVRLDSDDRLEPEYVRVLSSLMAKYPTAGFSHCHSNEIDADGTKKRVLRIRPRPEYVAADWALRDSASGMRVAANIIMYRAAALRQANYFAPGPRYYFEDWDLLVRLSDLGWGNVYSPGVLANYRVWSDANGFRAGRKMTEVNATIQVYQQTLTPAFQRRNWDIETLMTYRRRKAIRFTDALDSPLFTNTDRSDYQRALIQLGDSPGLRCRILLFRLGALPLIRLTRRLILSMKDAVKNVLDKRRESFTARAESQAASERSLNVKSSSETWHIITPEYPPTCGGVADYSKHVACGLRSKGDEVVVWCPTPGRLRDVWVRPISVASGRGA